MYRLICQTPLNFFVCPNKWLWWAPFFKCLYVVLGIYNFDHRFHYTWSLWYRWGRIRATYRTQPKFHQSLCPKFFWCFNTKRRKYCSWRFSDYFCRNLPCFKSSFRRKICGGIQCPCLASSGIGGKFWNFHSDDTLHSIFSHSVFHFVGKFRFCWVSYIEMALMNWFWWIKIYILSLVWRWFWNAERGNFGNHNHLKKK